MSHLSRVAVVQLAKATWRGLACRRAALNRRLVAAVCLFLAASATGAAASGAQHASASTLTPTPNSGHSYATTFPNTENPMSEGGHWGAGTTSPGNTNVQTTPGHAFGTFAVNGGPTYQDSIAVLNGTFGPDQSVQGTVVNNAQGSYVEDELLLRGNLTPSPATGRWYECTFSLDTDKGYALIVRLNGGGNSDFNILSQTNPGAPKTGDVISATAVGNVITEYINGVQVNQVTDSAISTGNPGIGFSNDTGGDGLVGLSAFAANDNSTMPTATPTATSTATVAPTNTPVPTATATAVPASPTPTSTATSMPPTPTTTPTLTSPAGSTAPASSAPGVRSARHPHFGAPVSAQPEQTAQSDGPGQR
jgi:hypothetical protein